MPQAGPCHARGMDVVLRALRDAAALVVAARCPGCDAPGSMLCDACRGALAARPLRRTSPGGLPLYAAVPFEGVAARVIRTLKADGATSLARPLGQALRVVIRALPPEPPLVPVPTSRAAFRRRGYRVPELLVRRAGFDAQRLLLPGHRIADQRGLGRDARARNVHGSMRVAAGRHPPEVIVVDDVITSGATLDEAARVLARSGLRVIAGVALASTPTHDGLARSVRTH